MPPSPSQNTAAKHRQSLTRNTKLWVLLGVLVVAVVALTFDRSQYKALHATKAQITSEQASIAKLNTALRQQSSGNSTVLRTATQEATKAEQFLPHDTPARVTADQAKALTAITSQVKADGLKLNSISAAQPAPGPPGTTGWEVAISVSGSLSAVENWVGQIQSATPLESISNATLTGGTSGATGQSTYTMQATVSYWYTQTATPVLTQVGSGARPVGGNTPSLTNPKGTTSPPTTSAGTGHGSASVGGGPTATAHKPTAVNKTGIVSTTTKTTPLTHKARISTSGGTKG